MTQQTVKRVDDPISLRDVRMIKRNFAGEERLPYNTAGKRNFVIPLDPELALQLREIGWKVWDNSNQVATGNAEELAYFLTVTVKFGKIPPRLFLITKSKNRRTPLDEDTVMLLDVAEFDKVDVIIRPFNWDVSGKQGVSAYLKTGYFILHEDELDLEYAHIPLDGEPLEIENIIDAHSELDTGWVEDQDMETLDEIEQREIRDRKALGG